MSKKIINIVIFAVAIVACVSALYFSVAFDDTKKDKYYEVGDLKANNPQMLIDLAAATPENLLGFIEKYQQEAAKLNADLKEQGLQRNVEYTFITNLSDLQSETAFTDFKANFDVYTKGLLAKSKRADFFVNGFNKVNKLDDLANYVATLEKDYAPVNQEYIVQKEYVKSFNNFLARVDGINSSPSANRKATELTTLQEDVAASKTEEGMLNFSIILVYVIFFATIAILLVFALIQIATNIKNSYKALLGVLFIVLLLVIGYFMSSGDLSTSAIKMQHTVSEVKWIGSGVFTFYIVLFLSLAAIVVSAIINAIKNR
jgi:NADH:ubiquinone oxidoreductase subunit 6 (subunit J)